MFDCIFEDSSELENLPLLNIELTLFLQFCFFDDLLKLCFLTKCLFFSPQLMKRKRNKNQLFKYFWRMLLRKKILENHKHNWLLIIWIFKKLNSLKSNYLTNYLQSKTTFWAKLSHSITRTLIALNKFLSSLCLSSDLSYRESTVAAPISFH